MEPLADNVKDACTRLGISVSSFYRLLSEKQLTAVKVRGRTLVLRDEQTRFLSSAPKA